MIRLVMAHGSRLTGRLLQGMLVERGLRIGDAGEATVSYGVRLGQGAHQLNAMAGGRTKYAELEELARAGLVVPWHCRARDWRDALPHRPVLARRDNHRGGTDIRLVKTVEGVRVWAGKRDFFSQFITSDTEFRVQVYRNSHLGTYEKILVHPEMQHRTVGRNHTNGYGFRLLREPQIPRTAVETAKRAVRALGLDFGAVDMLHGTDGRFYVLEVNTAPGGEDGRQWLNSLADHIARWAQRGYPNRRGEDA